MENSEQTINVHPFSNAHPFSFDKLRTGDLIGRSHVRNEYTVRIWVVVLERLSDNSSRIDAFQLGRNITVIIDKNQYHFWCSYDLFDVEVVRKGKIWSASSD